MTRTKKAETIAWKKVVLIIEASAEALRRVLLKKSSAQKLCGDFSPQKALRRSSAEGFINKELSAEILPKALLTKNPPQRLCRKLY